MHTQKKNRKATDTLHPAYMILEAIQWSDIHRRWFVLPRRVSREVYNEVLDEQRGSNIVMSCAEDFTDVKRKIKSKPMPTLFFLIMRFLPPRETFSFPR